MQNKQKELMSLKEVAAFLNIGYSTIRVWRFKKKFNLPCIKYSVRKVFYKRKDIEKFLKDKELDTYSGESKNAKNEKRSFGGKYKKD